MRNKGKRRNKGTGEQVEDGNRRNKGNKGNRRNREKKGKGGGTRVNEEQGQEEDNPKKGSRGTRVTGEIGNGRTRARGAQAIARKRALLQNGTCLVLLDCPSF